MYLTIVPVQATITATRFAIEKRPRLRLIRRSRGFDQYTDQYQKISGWTQWTRQLFVPTENGAKSAGKHPIAGLLRPDASSHAGGHWFESSSLHQRVPDFLRNQEPFLWVRKPPALPVEVPRKKALASSNERSELLTSGYHRLPGMKDCR